MENHLNIPTDHKKSLLGVEEPERVRSVSYNALHDRYKRNKELKDQGPVALSTANSEANIQASAYLSNTALDTGSTVSHVKSVPVVAKAHTQQLLTSVNVCLPDGTQFKSVLNFTLLHQMDDLVKYICDKVGLKYQDYELIEKRNEIEKLIKTEESPFTYIAKIKLNSDVQLCLRKKNSNTDTQPSGRKLNFVPTSRTSSKHSIVSEEQSNPVTIRRRNSFQEGIAYLTGLTKTGNSSLKETPNKGFSKFEVTHISLLDSNDRRALQIYLPEIIAKLFAGTGCTLNFQKLSERNRFMSWSKKPSTDQKVFGVPYQTIIEAEYLNDPSIKIPHFLTLCLEFILEHGISKSGIFRISGVSRKIKKLKEEIESGKLVSINPDEYKPHDVSSLLKLYLRELPEPIMTFKLYDFYIAAVKYLQGDKLDECLKLLSIYLPISNIYLVEELFKLLFKISQNAGPTLSVTTTHEGDSDTESQEPVSTDGNLMTVSNLSIVIAPNLLKPKDEKAVNALTDIELVTKVIERMIERSDWMFNIPGELLYEFKKSKVER